jgi:hypothetical protein
MTPSGNTGRRKRNENCFLPKNKLVQDSEGNKENGYPDPDSNKTKINYAKEPNEPTRGPRMKKSCK